MKKNLLLVLLLFSAFGFSQPITVSTSSHTVPQLVNNVLINSPCVSASNVTWSTGTNFGSSNGIGYFQNTNPNFPMQSGVILSTGNAQNAAGPNQTMLSDGSSSWSGDSDLEATLLQAGLPAMISTNATILEFDFTPISSHFNFGFIFASEEYGNFQCQFSDAFAFLLTNMNTGVTTNLAIVPGTSDPISVLTIRDFLYNSSCPSENPQYFGTYNGGSAAAGSATNFNGQTVLMNASAELIPDTPYHIKLVIADRSDHKSDSAIFMSSNSFNIGQDVLGLDRTIANRTAICFGQSHLLHTDLDPAEYTFSWTKNGLPINGATGADLTVTGPGTYGVTYVSNLALCDPKTDLVVVEYYPQFTTPAPINLYRCNSGASSYVFDLSLNTPKISQGVNPAPLVSYFASSADANNNENALPLSYSSAGGQTIYVRIQNADTGCHIIKQFQLLITPPAFANQPANLVKCARNFTATDASFNLTSQNASILGGQATAINTVSYFTSAANAANNINPIATPNNTLVGTQTIYVRVQNTTDPACYALTSFTVTINPLPPVDVLQDVIVCDPYQLSPLVNGNYFTGTNGTGTPLFAGDWISSTQVIYIFNQPGGPPNCANQSSFKVTIINPLSAPTGGTFCNSYTLPSLPYGKYRTQPNGGGTVIAPGTVITTTTTLYVYYITPTAPFCTVDVDFIVTIVPKPNVGTFQNVFDCTAYTLPPLAVGNYFTQSGGQGTPLFAGDEITSTQTVFVFAQNNNGPNCTDQKSFNVVIGMPTPSDVNQCNPYTLPTLSIGNYFTGPNGTGTQLAAGSQVNQTSTIYIYIPNSSSCGGDIHFTVSITQPPVDRLTNVKVCESYTLPALTNGNYYTAPGGTGTMLNAGDVITSTKTIYVYATTGVNCSNQSSFVVTIVPLPAIDSRAGIDQCNSYTLTALAVGNYYTGPNATGTQLHAGDVITTSQTIYIHAFSNTTPRCEVENTFTINIFSIEADSFAPVTACDSYVLPALSAGNYYFTNTGGILANTAATTKHAGDLITSNTTLYIYRESGERINCTDENIFSITINKTPVLAPVADLNACRSYTLPVLTIGNYFTGTNGTGTQLNAGDAITTSQKIFVYAQTSTTPNCAKESSFNVTIIDVTAPTLAPITACDTFELPVLAVGQYFTGSNATGTELFAGHQITTSTTLYVFVRSSVLPSCTDEKTFEITINHTPVLALVADLNACRSYTLPVLTVGNYFTGTNGTGTQLNAGDAITTSQKIFVYAQTSTNPNCAKESSFNVTIIDVTAPTLAPVTACDTFELPVLAVGQYFTGSNATGTELFAGHQITTSTTLYVFVRSSVLPSCTDEKTFEITINKTPVLAPVADLNACRSYTLPVLTVGNYFTATNGTGTQLNAGDAITTSQKIFVYAQTSTTPNCAKESSFNVTIIDVTAPTLAPITACDTFELPVLTVGQYFTGSNATGTELFAGHQITTSTTLYVFVRSSVLPSCTDEKTFEITINHTPVLAPVADLNACRSYTLPVLTVGNYFTGTNGTGTQLNAGDLITTSQQIFVYAQTNTNPNCAKESSFNVTIIDVTAPTLAPITACDTFELPVLAVGQYFTGSNATGTELFAGHQITTSTTLYVFVRSSVLPSCTDEKTFEITINHTPVLALVADLNVCRSYTLPVLTVGNYFTGTNGTGTQLNAGDAITTSQKIFVYAQTSTNPNCAKESSFNVTIIDVTAPTLAPVTACDTFELPVLAVGQYFTGSNATGTELFAGHQITTSTTLYVFVRSSVLPSCTDEKTFEITINHTPVLAPVADLNACRSYTLPVLTVGNYFAGTNGTGTQLNAGDLITTSQQIFVYAQTSTTPNCWKESSFNVTIIDVTAPTLAPISACDTFELPVLAVGQYFTGSNATGTELFAGHEITTSTTLYVFVRSSVLPSCTDEKTFEITINHTPVLPILNDIDACRSYTLPALPIGAYYTSPNARGQLHSGDVITSTQEIFVYAATNTNPVCWIEDSFTVTIHTIEAETLAPAFACNSYTLPALANGKYFTGSNATGTELHAGDTVTASTTLYVFVESTIVPGCTDQKPFDITIYNAPNIGSNTNVNACNSYTLPVLAIGNYYAQSNASGTPLQAGDVLTSNQTIYVFARNPLSFDCTSEKTISINIFNVDDVDDVITCASYVLPIPVVGKYYTGQNGTGTLLAPGTAITTSRTIYIYAQSPFSPVCYDQTSFDVTIIATPVAYPVPASMTTVCDEDENNDGITEFDLESLSDVILGNQTGAEFTIAYYETLAHANAGINEVSFTSLASVWVRVNNALAPDCFDVKKINIKVNKLPIPEPIGGTICFISETQTAVNTYTIPSGLSANTHTFKWTNSNGTVVGTSSSYTATLPGTYTVVATHRTTGCVSDPVSVEVVGSEPPIIAFTVGGEDFTNNQSLTVHASGNGEYEYMLDFGPFQTSNVFENVSSGWHTITVRDINGCGKTTTEALVINYPRYFTPNGDGFHDTWNIVDLKDLPNSIIYIFDRYGKLLKQIRPDQAGWDGTYNGNNMPSSDYWFTVNYEKDGAAKEFRAHFSLKR